MHWIRAYYSADCSTYLGRVDTILLYDSDLDHSTRGRHATYGRAI